MYFRTDHRNQNKSWFYHELSLTCNSFYLGHVIDTTSASELLHILCPERHSFSDIIGYWWSHWLIHGEPSLVLNNVTDLQYKVIIIHYLDINLQWKDIHRFHKDASIFDSLVDGAWNKTEHYCFWVRNVIPQDKLLKICSFIVKKITDNQKWLTPVF